MKQKTWWLYVPEALCYPAFYYLARHHFCSIVITEAAKSGPEALKKTKVPSDFSRKKKSAFKIIPGLGYYVERKCSELTTQVSTGLYNMEMILKIIDIWYEKVIWKLLSPIALFSASSIFSVSTCSLIIHEVASIRFVPTTLLNCICQWVSVTWAVSIRF